MESSPDLQWWECSRLFYAADCATPSSGTLQSEGRDTALILLTGGYVVQSQQLAHTGLFVVSVSWPTQGDQVFIGTYLLPIKTLEIS